VEAVYAKLLAASSKGGVLRYKVKSIFVDTQSETFAGLSTDTGFKAGAYNPRKFLYIPKSVLTEGGPPADQTPASYSQTVQATLYPAGSTATDGFVLPASAASYEFQIRSGYGITDAASVTMIIDDFEVIANADPQIVYTPPLPTGSASFVGRILSNTQVDGTFSATGLPPGVVIDPATGLVYGTPTTNGTYNVVFSVTRAGITNTINALTWQITGAAPAASPVITSFTISGSTAVINWSGTGVAPVNVERSSTLASGSWTIISPGNTTGTFTDNSAPAGKAFYRVVVP
jgi:hypothetical protein